MLMNEQGRAARSAFRPLRLSLALAAAALTVASTACYPPPEPTRLPELMLGEELEPAVRGQIIKAQARVTQLLKADEAGDRDTAAALGHLGMVYHAYQRLDSASTCYRQARRLDPDEFRWAYYDGVVSRSMGDYEASEAALAKALELRPDDVPTLLARGENAFDRLQLDVAEARFQKALAIAPGSVSALFGIGRVALERGEPRLALETLQAAHGLQPNASPILYALGLAHRGVGDADTATSFFDRVPRSHLTSRGVAVDDPMMRKVAALDRGALGREHRGLKAAAQGRFDLAVAEFREVVALDGGRVEARHNLALALLRLGRREEAVAEIHEILARWPHFVPSLVLLAQVEQHQGDVDEAESRLRAAISADPQSAKAHHALAQLLEATGRSELAAVSFESARALDPTL